MHLDTCTQRDVHVPTSYRTCTGLTVPVDSFMGGGRDGGSRYAPILTLTGHKASTAAARPS